MATQDKYDEAKVAQDGSLSARQKRVARRAERRAGRQAGGMGWLVGVVLIAIGLVYLLTNSGIMSNLTNWWALFLLIPAAAILSAAVGAYRHNGGQWTMAVVGPLLGSLLLAGLSAALLFGFDYGWLWPLFLIAAGFLLLAGTFLSRGKSQP